MTNMVQSPHVVAENDHLKVIFQPGTSDFLLITFGDLVVMANGLRFFADVPVRKAGIACLAFMPKKGSWYPRSSMEGVVDVVREYLDRYETIISYGGSMGGYAAIKYSRLLRCTHVISLCPQWSLDRDECGGTDPGWQGFFDRESMTGMGIRPSDCGGTTYVFYDPYDRTDVFHAEKIKDASSAHLMAVPRVDHNVTPTLSGSETLINLIAYCRADDRRSIRRLVRGCRRVSPYRVNKVVRFAERRFPVLFRRRLMDLFSGETMPDIELRHAILAMRALVRAGRDDTVPAIFETYRVRLTTLPWMHSTALHVSQGSRRGVYLTTFHGTVVAYDLGANRLVHSSIEEINAYELLLPVRIHATGTSFWMFVEPAGSRLYVGYVNGTVATSHAAEDALRFQVEPVGDSYLCMAGGKYLAAEKFTDEVACDRDTANAWERFSIGIR